MSSGTKDLWYKPKLIEVALPLEDISRESAKEKSIRHGHPSTLHLWWSRKPLAAARAVLFAQLVDDPSAHPEQFPTEEQQKDERSRLHGIISRLVTWGNVNNENLLREAHEEILKSANGNPPPVLDPFAGGGSIPLEAQRLGLEAHASDLNPIAVLVNKALIEFPQKWAGHKPVFPGVAEERLAWPSVTGLAEDVLQYGRWVRSEAEKRIGYLYPKVNVGGADYTVISWIWARTVTCPNPACAGTMPLVNNFWLGKKKGKERYIIPRPNGKRVRFEVGGPNGTPRNGTVGRTGAECLLCGTPVPLAYIREEGKSGRLGMQLMAIAAEGKRQRLYVAPTDDQEKIADVPYPDDAPDAELPEEALGFRVQGYGMNKWADLFSNRQLTALTTFSTLVSAAHAQIIADGASPDYATAVVTYIAMTVDRLADLANSLCGWEPIAECPRHLFGKQTISMLWGFAEGNPFGTSSGSFQVLLEGGERGFLNQGFDFPRPLPGEAKQQDANAVNYRGVMVSTDPPYYDNIGYADLSDFFYVWLRKSLGQFYPELMPTLLSPKAAELVANPHRHEDPESFFENGFTQVFSRACGDSVPEYPMTVFYAFKQAENDADGQQVSTGWETLLEGMIKAGWAVTGTWPIRTENASRLRGQASNALASSIALACRPRPIDAGFTDRRGLINALREEFPDALKKLEQCKIAPVDLRQAAIGPGMAVFSRYARVNEPDGSPMRVRAALSLINQVLDEKLSESVGHVSADTRFCVEWFRQYGFDDGPFGTADVLARGVDTSVSGLERAGVLVSRAGKVKLQSVVDLPGSYDPAADDRTSEWEVCLHLAKALSERGADVAAALLAAARNVPAVDLDDVLDLAYLLYSVAEKKGWAETALLFNNLGTSWTDIEDLSRKGAAVAAAGQGEFMLEYGSTDLLETTGDGDE